MLAPGDQTLTNTSTVSVSSAYCISGSELGVFHVLTSLFDSWVNSVRWVLFWPTFYTHREVTAVRSGPDHKLGPPWLSGCEVLVGE